MHHIFVDENSINLVINEIVVDCVKDKDNYNHLAKVLRVNEGEIVLCSIIPFNFTFDYRTKIISIDKQKIVLSILEESKANELDIKISLYQGIAKADKMEYIIEKAVELGAYNIIPLESEFCVAKMQNEKIDKKLERLNKISCSAAEQSKRNIIPEVLKPITFKQMIETVDASSTLLFYENAKGIDYTKESIKSIIKENKKEISIIIGPEGGFSEKEIDLAKNKGIKILSLGGRILRTETAAITALSILMYEIENK